MEIDEPTSTNYLNDNIDSDDEYEEEVFLSQIPCN